MGCHCHTTGRLCTLHQDFFSYNPNYKIVNLGQRPYNLKFFSLPVCYPIPVTSTKVALDNLFSTKLCLFFSLILLTCSFSILTALNIDLLFQSEIGFGKIESYTKLDKLGEVSDHDLHRWTWTIYVDGHVLLDTGVSGSILLVASVCLSVCVCEK